MTPFEYISKYIFIKLKPSPISGIGLFSIKEIPTDTFPFEEWQGETGFYPITQPELQLLDLEIRNQIMDFFSYSTDFPKDTNIYIKLTKGCHWLYANPYSFINSGFYENLSNIDKDTLRTTRLIKKGEELLSNYSRYNKIDKNLI